MTGSERPANRGKYIRTIFDIADVLVVNFAFLLTSIHFNYFELSGTYLRMLWIVLNASCVPMLAWNARLKHDARVIAMERVTRNVLVTVSLHALFFMSLNAFLHFDIAGVVYITFYGLATVFLLLFRLSANYTLKAMRRRGFNFTRVAIIGAGRTAMRLYSCMQTDTGYGYRVLGIFDDNPEENLFTDKVYGIDQLEDFVVENHIQQIFFTLPGHNDALARVTKIADDHVVDFYYVPQIPHTLSRRFQLNNIGPLPVLSIRPNPLNNIFNRAVKRAFDIAMSGTFLIFYPLIYIPVALAIKITSPGPVYFKQERTGYMGKTFKCYKFRTMHVNNDADKVQATQNDPRKTRLGDLLRRTSLDELPQFINVLRGDMSVVGPRPHMLKHTELYTSLVESYMVRHAVKPGITGWAQVNGYRGITDELWKMERRVEHDVWYIENWSFLLDLKIIVRTVINAFAGEKNAF